MLLPWMTRPRSIATQPNAGDRRLTGWRGGISEALDGADGATEDCERDSGGHRDARGSVGGQGAREAANSATDGAPGAGRHGVPPVDVLATDCLVHYVEREP